MSEAGSGAPMCFLLRILLAVGLTLSVVSVASAQHVPPAQPKAVGKEKPKSRKPKLSDPTIKMILIHESIGDYPGKCPCPYIQASNGSKCGKRSAYSRDGGHRPLCYSKDVTKKMVEAYRQSIAGVKSFSGADVPRIPRGVRVHTFEDGRVRIVVPTARPGEPRRGGEALSPDPVGMRMWQLCDGRSIDQIVATIVAEYEVDAETARTDVVEWLDLLRLKGALE